MKTLSIFRPLARLAPCYAGYACSAKGTVAPQKEELAPSLPASLPLRRGGAPLKDSNASFGLKHSVGVINKFGFSNCTSIAIYGSNLGSTVEIGRYSFSLKKFIFLTSDSYSIIVGMLLSDGWLEKYSLNSNTRFKFKQAIFRSDYVIYSFMALSHYCSNMPYTNKGKRKGILFYSLEFSTRYLPCFNEIYDLFYIDKVKVIPVNIYDLLTPIAIAHWIMGDGAKLNKGLVLCTDSFTVQEVITLMNVLKIKYDINSSIQGIHNQRPRIYILQESMPKLINIVQPYLLPSMLYKLHLN